MQIDVSQRNALLVPRMSSPRSLVGIIEFSLVTTRSFSARVTSVEQILCRKAQASKNTAVTDGFSFALRCFYLVLMTLKDQTIPVKAKPTAGV